MASRVRGLGIGLLILGFAASACTVTSSGDGDDDDDDSSAAGAPSSTGGRTGDGDGGEAGGDPAGEAGDEGRGGSGGADGSSTGDEGGSGGADGSSTGDAGAAGDTGETGAAGDSSTGAGGAPTTTATAIECESRDPDDATEVTGSITEDQTWSGTVHLTGNVDVHDGVTITIEPGTNIIMGVDSSLELGWNSGSTTLNAEGTEADPIRFCGELADPGFWRDITFRRNATSNSVMRNVLIADGGGSTAAVILDADITVENLQISNSDTVGIEAVDFREGSSGLSVSGSGDAAVVLTGAGAATRFPLGGTFSDNDDNTVHIAFARIQDDTVFHDVGIPYVQDGSIDVYGGLDLTFEAGVDYRFTPDVSLEIGWNSNDPALFVNGTEAAPVVFRGVNAEPGYWGGVIIRGNVLSNTTLSHLRILHAGATMPALTVSAPVTLDNVSIDQSGTGARIDAQGLAEDSQNLSITGTAGVPLTVPPNALVTLPQGGDFTGNESDRIAIEAGSYTETGVVPNLGVPYLVMGDIDTRASSMTLTAGTEFLMSADSSIEFGWNSSEATIIAVGTEDAPIRFTGTDETPGFWEGLIVRRNVLSASRFEYVEIGHAGGTGNANAALRLDTPITVENCTFFSSAAYGIVATAADPNDYESSNTFTDTATAAVGSL